jgi:hypothetical protein
MKDTDLPFVLVAMPFWHHPQGNPKEVVTTSLRELRVSYNNQPFCLVLDSHYDSKDVFEVFQNEEKFYFCIGLVASRHAEIYDVLQTNLSWGEWNACKSDTRAIYSVKIEKELDNSKTVHFCCSNFLKESITRNTITTPNTTTINVQNGPIVYTEENLKKNTIPQLQAICTALRLKRSGTKPKLIARIITSSSSSLEQKEELIEKITSFSSKKTPNVNSFYKNNFNGVDRSDGYWNMFDYNFIMDDWKSKLFWCVLKHSFLNLFVLMNSFQKMEFTTFREMLIKELVAESLKKE